MDIDMVSFTPHQGQGFYCVSPMEKVFVLRTSADYSYTLFTLINRLYTHFGICVVWLNIWNSCRQFTIILLSEALITLETTKIKKSFSWENMRQGHLRIWPGAQGCPSVTTPSVCLRSVTHFYSTIVFTTVS